MSISNTTALIPKTVKRDFAGTDSTYAVHARTLNFTTIRQCDNVLYDCAKKVITGASFQFDSTLEASANGDAQRRGMLSKDINQSWVSSMLILRLTL